MQPGAPPPPARGSGVGPNGAGTPPGWYPDPGGVPGVLRWWSGARWENATAARSRPGLSHRSPAPLEADLGWLPAHWAGPSDWPQRVPAPPRRRWRLRGAVACAAAAVGGGVAVWAVSVLWL